MARRLREAVMARWLSGLLVSVTMVAVVSGLIALLDPHVPVLSLLVLYILVVLPAGRHGRLPGDGGGGGRADGPGAARGAGVGAPLGGAGGVAAGGDPAVLAEGGLGPALRTLARRSAVPVELEVGTQARLPERVEVTAYHVVSEALTNVAKHADASVARVDVEAGGGLLRVCVRDDGVGGADPTRGSGLVGLKDRVEAVGGTLRVESLPGQGTRLQVELPLDAGYPPST